MFIHCQEGRWWEIRNWSTRRGFFMRHYQFLGTFFSFLLKSTLECKASCYPLCKREKSELAYTPNNFVVLISCNWSKYFLFVSGPRARASGRETSAAIRRLSSRCKNEVSVTWRTWPLTSNSEKKLGNFHIFLNIFFLSSDAAKEYCRGWHGGKTERHEIQVRWIHW